MTPWIKPALLLGHLMAASGCYSVEQAMFQPVTIESHPAGASVLILPEGRTVTTPIKVKLGRNQVHTLRIELAGYCRETVHLDRIIQYSSILDPPAEWTSDPALGGDFRLVPENVDIELWPVDALDRECGPFGSLPWPVESAP